MVGGQRSVPIVETLSRDLVDGDIGSIVTGTGGRQGEGLDGEWEVVVIGVVDKEPVVNGLLHTLCLVTFWHQRTRRAACCAFLDPGGLGQGLVVSFYTVHDDTPLAGGVYCSQWHQVPGVTGAKISLLWQFNQSVHTVLCVGQHILVQSSHTGVVVLHRVRNLVCRVLIVLETPWLGCVL